MRLVVMPGDGIGPEVTAATVRVLEKLDRRLDLGIALETHEVGFKTLGKEGTTLPGTALKAAHEADGVILGPVSTLDIPRSRRADQCLGRAPPRARPLRQSLAGPQPPRHPPLRAHGDVFRDRAREHRRVLRGGTMYLGYGEFMPTPDLAFAIRKVSAAASRRIARAGSRWPRGGERRSPACTRRTCSRRARRSSE